MDQILGATRSLPTPTPSKWIAAEEHVKDVHGGVEAGAAATRPALFDGLLAALVVDLALLRVGENLVGHGDLLELLPGGGILVGVVLHGQFSTHREEVEIKE